jgi:hypothetical protein
MRMVWQAVHEEDFDKISTYSDINVELSNI